MARNNSNKKYNPHANWDLPGGVRNLDGETVKVSYHHQPDQTEAKRRKARNHNNAMRRLRAKQAELAAC